MGTVVRRGYAPGDEKEFGEQAAGTSLETGRKNQIRVHAAEIGHPVAGDRKYGAATNPLHRLCLHARTLTLKHPVTGEILSFDTGIPRSFLKII